MRGRNNTIMEEKEKLNRETMLENKINSEVRTE
jgi:hypothetical protein